MSNEFSFNLAPGQAPFSQEQIVRAFEPFRPWPQNPSAIIYRARVSQLRAYYTRPVVNTPHPNLPQVYFADDIDFQDRMSGMVEWTRIWVTIPNSWNDYTSDAYTFPGIAFTSFTTGRVPVAKTVTSKLNYDYYLVGALPVFENTLSSYDNLAGGSWSLTEVVATANVANVPVCAGGTNAAALLVTNATGTPHSITQGGGAGTSQRTGAFFVKNGNTNIARVAIGSIGDYNSCQITVDLRTGQQLSSANCRPVVSAIGEGWWRIGIDAPTVSFSTPLLSLYLCDDSGNVVHSEGGRSCYGWRAVLSNANVVSLPAATVPPTAAADGTNYPIQQADNIPVRFGQNYVYAFVGNYVAEYLSATTVPNSNTYQTWVATDQGNSNSYSIESTDSTLQLWQGSVWQRNRNFVKAR